MHTPSFIYLFFSVVTFTEDNRAKSLDVKSTISYKMEESVLIFIIPAFFVLVCLLFITGNHFYYKVKGAKHQRMMGKVSIININNVANSSAPSSPKSARKHKTKKRPQSPNSLRKCGTNNTSTMDNFSHLSPVHLGQSDCPPSYQSLFEFGNQLQVPVETFGSCTINSSRKAASNGQGKEEDANNYAVLYL